MVSHILNNLNKFSGANFGTDFGARGAKRCYSIVSVRASRKKAKMRPPRGKKNNTLSAELRLPLSSNTTLSLATPQHPAYSFVSKLYLSY